MRSTFVPITRDIFVHATGTVLLLQQPVNGYAVLGLHVPAWGAGSGTPSSTRRSNVRGGSFHKETTAWKRTGL